MRSKLIGIKKDIAFVAFRWRFIFYRSFLVLKTYSNSKFLGLLFSPLLFLVSILAITLVWSKIFGRGNDGYWDFFLYIFIGFSLWELISKTINSGNNCLIKYSHEGMRSNDPPLIYLLQEVVSVFFEFIIRLPLMFVILVFIAKGIPILGMSVFVLGLVLIFLSGIGISMILAPLTLLFNEIRELCGSFLRLTFLLTPIIWKVERLGDFQHYIYFNPFYSYIEVCRRALIENQFAVKEFYITVVITISLLLLGSIIMAVNSQVIRKAFFKV